MSALVVAVLAAPCAFAQSAPAAAGAAGRQAPSSLGDSAELARVVGLYDSGRYADCAAALAELLRPGSARPLREPEVVQSARIYHAACLIGNGQVELADQPLQAAIHENPQMKPPDSLVFPPAVVERFLRVQEASLEDIRRVEAERLRKAQQAAAAQEARTRQERARVAALEKLAQEQTIVVQNRRAFALVPFGVGQFQNGSDSLGWTFLSSEVLLAAGALTSLGVYSHLILDAEQKRSRGVALDSGTNAQLKNWNSAVTYTSLAWLGVSVLGVVEAELGFVPERRELQRRALPKELAPQSKGLSLEPSAGAGEHGAWFGLRGSF